MTKIPQMVPESHCKQWKIRSIFLVFTCPSETRQAQERQNNFHIEAIIAK